MFLRKSVLKYMLRKWVARFLYTSRYMPMKRLISYLQYYNFLGRSHLRLTSKNSSFCILPWIHMYVDPLGEIFPCCVRAPGMKSFGNINQAPVEIAWNSTEMKTLRLDMLGNKQRPDV